MDKLYSYKKDSLVNTSLNQIAHKMSDKNELKINVVTLEGLLSNSKLNIPSYQRPYLWTEKQLDPLLQDLYNRAPEGQPTIMGGIILHNEKKIG